MVNLKRKITYGLESIYDKLIGDLVGRVIPNDRIKELNCNTNIVRIDGPIKSQCRTDLAKIKRQEIKLW